VQALTRAGREAHLAAIDFKTASTDAGPQSYGLALRDKRGQEVRWRFLPATAPSERGAGLTALPGVLGLRLDYRVLGTAAGAGTAVQIGDRLSEAAPWPEISAPPYFVAHRGSVTLGRHLGALAIGKESWQLRAAPAELREGAEWKLVGDKGRERVLRINARQGDLLTIGEISAASFQAATLSLQARATADVLAIQTAQLVSHAQTMRLSFKPELNLAAAGTGAEMTFQIDEGKAERVAQGVVILDRQSEAVRLRWQTKTPDWAKGRAIETTIKLTPNGYTIESAQAAK
jgi:hypothetical protein